MLDHQISNMVCVAFRALAAHVLTRHTFKVGILLVSTWMVVTLLSSINIKNQLKLPHLSLYYNISLNKDIQQSNHQTNNVQIYSSLALDKADNDADSKADIVYDTKKGIGLNIY